MKTLFSEQRSNELFWWLPALKEIDEMLVDTGLLEDVVYVNIQKLEDGIISIEFDDSEDAIYFKNYYIDNHEFGQKAVLETDTSVIFML